MNLTLIVGLIASILMIALAIRILKQIRVIKAVVSLI